MDVLSDALSAIKLDSAIYFNAEFGAPWAWASPEATQIAPTLAPGAHIITYHMLLEGTAFAQIDAGPDAAGERIELVAGDVVSFPHGEAHIIGSGHELAPVNAGMTLPEILAGGLELYREGGPGAPTRLICGFLACDPQRSRAFLGGLPSIVRVNIREDDPGRWLEGTLRRSVDEAAAGDAGSQAMLTRLSETVFAETVRRFVRELPADQTGFLAGTRDPEVGRALTLLHQRPAEPWTVASLAHEVGLSRTVLAERFRYFLGEPPMSYLTHWRLRLAARTLVSGAEAIAEVARSAGYESEAAFSRAFKREFNTPPAQYRRAALGASRGAPA